MFNLMEEALDQLKDGGDVQKAQVYALLLIASALQEVGAIAAVLEERTITVRVEK